MLHNKRSLNTTTREKLVHHNPAQPEKKNISDVTDFRVCLKRRKWETQLRKWELKRETKATQIIFLPKYVACEIQIDFTIWRANPALSMWQRLNKPHSGRLEAASLPEDWMSEP